MQKTLHVLSQRPSLTGSGVTLDALVREADRAGWEQWVVVGVPADDGHPSVGGLEPERVHPLRFAPEGGAGAVTDVPFPVPGMSDVMPYKSSRWSRLTPEQLSVYREAWRTHLEGVLRVTRPDIIHAHHAWVLSALLRDVVGDIPLLLHGHGTALRQLRLCPDLAPEVTQGCRRADGLMALHRSHAHEYAQAYGWPADDVHVVGAGYREDLFHPAESAPDRNAIAYAGKLADAKGLHPLLDALETLWTRGMDVTLHVAGSGSGAEADDLRVRMQGLGDRVVLHGRLDQAGLATLFRRCSVFVLPSFYEGLPLVLVEALACGCRLVSSELPGVGDALEPIGDAMTVVPLPSMIAVDRPDPDGLPAYAEGLADALADAVAQGPVKESLGKLRPFTWGAVFERVERLWNSF